jgi:two-component system response regulator HydG
MTEEKASILIVDDDESICRTLSLYLKTQGYETDLAMTGREAIKKTKKKTYDVALLDIKLPDMEGTELLKAMRKTTPKMIKIMVTGYPTLGNAVEALKLNADDYIMKPVAPEELVKTITRKLEKRKEDETMTEKKLAEFITIRTTKLLQTSPTERTDRKTKKIS